MNMIARGRGCFGGIGAGMVAPVGFSRGGLTAKKTRHEIAEAAKARLAEASRVVAHTLGKLIEEVPQGLVDKAVVVEAAKGPDPLAALSELHLRIQEVGVQSDPVDAMPLVTMQGRGRLRRDFHEAHDALKHAPFLRLLGDAVQQLSDQRIFRMIATHVSGDSPELRLEVVELPLFEMAQLFDVYTGNVVGESTFIAY